MKNIKLIILIFLFSVKSIFSQYYFSEKNFQGDLHFAKKHNPAIIPNYSSHFNIAGVFQDLSFGATVPINYNSILKADPSNIGRNIINLDDISSKINGKDIRSMIDANVNLFDIGIRTEKGNYFNIGLNFKTNVFFNIDYDLYNAIPFLGEGFTGEEKSYRIDKTKFMGVAYSEFYLGYSTIYENWTFGGRLKFLYGLSSSGSLQKASLIQKSDYSLELISNHTVKIPVNKKLSNFSDILNYAGLGIAMDLGTTYKMEIKDNLLTFGASVLDVGFIRSPKGYNYRSDGGSIIFEGAKIEDLTQLKLNQSFSDILKSIEESSSKDSSGYTVILASTLNLSADWEFYNGNHLGGNYFMRFYGSSWVVAGNIYYSFIGKYGGISPSINFYNYSPHAGISGFLNLGGFSMFIGVDNILGSTFRYSNQNVSFNSSSINFNFGISLAMGSDKYRNKINPDIEIKDSQNEDNSLPSSKLTEEQIKKIDDSKRSFKEKNNIE